VQIGSIVWHAEGVSEGAADFEVSCTSPAVSGDRVHCASAVVRDARGKHVLAMTRITGRRLGQVIPLRRGERRGGARMVLAEEC
jgi:hypothetical protein